MLAGYCLLFVHFIVRCLSLRQAQCECLLLQKAERETAADCLLLTATCLLATACFLFVFDV